MKVNYTYNVIQETVDLGIDKSYQTSDRKVAVDVAKEWITKKPNALVYISFYDLDGEFYYVDIKDVTERIIKWKRVMKK